MARTIGYWALGAAGAVVAGLIVFGFVTEGMLKRKDHPPLVPIVASSDAGAVTRGQHLGTIYGCMGCHGENLQGQGWFEDPREGALDSANLTRAMPHYTDAQLARAIRAGVRPDGSALWDMPSESWIEVTDAEVADLIAWLRTHPPAGKPSQNLRLTFVGRVALLMGKIRPSATYVAEARANPAFDAGPTFARGRHLASTVCSECHGSNLKGRPGDTPDLLMAAAYDDAHFRRLMKTGIGMGGQELGLMTMVARSRFSHLSEQDVTDLHAYLTARAERME